MDPRIPVYRSGTGPDGKGREFTHSLVAEALVFVALCFDIVELYPYQVTSILALFTGQHLLSLHATGGGKTFCFWGVIILYDFLFNGHPRGIRQPSDQLFSPIMYVISPLNSLMVDQTEAFNRLVDNCQWMTRKATFTRAA